jgi:cysteinyl-tRNA synthetase
MHNGMLELGGDEMHKSVGNDVSLRNVLDTWGREATLVLFLGGHWHGPIDFSTRRWMAAA